MPGERGTVRVDRAGRRATVVWNRPPVNVFDTALLEGLAKVLRSEVVRSAHVVVLRGANHRWSAGFSVEDHFTDRIRPMFQAFRGVLEAIGKIAVPTLGQVEGPCLGGGLEVLSACDLAFASASATFGQPEIRLGVFPPVAAANLRRSVGPKRAAEILLLGEIVTAPRAEKMGLISRVAPDSRINDEVDRAATRLEGFRPEALVLLKRAMGGAPVPRDEPMERAERIYLEELAELPQAEEGLRAFLEKRAPVWPTTGG